MNQIPCQCTQPLNGCPSCSGFGYVLELAKCHACFRTYWVRPGVHTMYEGKRWRTFDGLAMVVKDGRSVCFECGEKS